MHILHLACIAPPKTGGIGVVAQEEVDRLNARGGTAELQSPTEKNAYWQYGNTAILKFGWLKRLVQSADVVHLHYPFYGTAEQVAWMRRRGWIKSLIITVHMDASAPGWKGWIANLHRATIQDWILSSADHVLFSSLDYATHSSFRRFVEAHPEKCVELPFGVDTNRFRPANQTRSESSAPVIGFVGGMDTSHAFKGVEILLRAFASIMTPCSPPERGTSLQAYNLQPTTLLLIGDGNLRSSYEALAKDLGIADRCDFRGRVSDAELPRMYQQMDILAFPSTTGAEAFGLVALEAQATGIPVVASDLPGVRTVVSDTETGILVEPRSVEALGNALRMLLANPEFRTRMGKAARARVEQRFSWDQHVEALQEVYRLDHRMDSSSMPGKETI